MIYTRDQIIAELERQAPLEKIDLAAIEGQYLHAAIKAALALNFLSQELFEVYILNALKIGQQFAKKKTSADG